MTFRLVMQEVALEQGLFATFMPKPFRDHPGSGMHTHLSLLKVTEMLSLRQVPRINCPKSPGRSSLG